MAAKGGNEFAINFLRTEVNISDNELRAEGISIQCDDNKLKIYSLKDEEELICGYY